MFHLAAFFALLCVQPPSEAQVRTAAASLSGTVVTDESTSRPIARAVVTLAGAELRPNLTVITDAEGRFSFTGIPAGRFTLSASKPPYLTVAFGQTVAGAGSGVPIAVEDGQQISGLTLKLPRGGVIIGRVLDDRSRPLPGAPIVVMQYRTVRGERALQPIGGAQPRTDGRGVFRVFGLAAGDYFVAACPPGNYMVLINCSSGGGDLRQVDQAEIDWALQQLRGGTRSGSRNASRPAGQPSSSGQTVAYGAVFYPGTTDRSAAMAVTIGPGEERDGVDIAMQLQPTARIEGHVLGPGGEPLTDVRVSFGGAGGTSSTPSRDGTFSYRDLLPGQYWIGAQVPGSAASTFTEVVVNGQDITGLALTIQPALTISGRVALDPAGGKPQPDLTAVRLGLGAIQENLPMVFPVSAGADGTFRIGPVAPGRYRLTASVAAGDGRAWTIGSANVRGRDAVDIPFEVRTNESLSNILVTLTDRRTELSGTVVDAAGRPAPGHYVVVFPADRSFWVTGARRLPAPVRAATDGGFSVSGLPAGTYFVATLAEVNLQEIHTDASLEALSRSAVSVTLAIGEKMNVTLRIPNP
jgi:Carboxypeptidase regulatory-like domain